MIPLPYCVIYAAVAGGVTYIVAKVMNVDFNGSYGFSSGGILTTVATIAGFCVGLGVGATKISTGTYLS